METLSVKAIGGGTKNAFVQVTGFSSTEFHNDWIEVVTRPMLEKPFKNLHLDAVYHAIAEGLEVQLAWRSAEELQPIMPIAGRGRIDFSEASGLQPTLQQPMESIVMRVLGTAKNPSPCLMLLIDLSLHQGAM